MSFRICLIGCGGHARKVHGPSLKKYAARRPGIELAACCDLDDARTAAFQENFGFARRYRDIAEMLNTEKPDAVSLIMHVNLTCEIGCRVMEMGYPVLMEKPPGLTVAEVDRLIETAEKTGVPHMVAFNRRQTPLIRALKQRLDAAHRPEEIQHLRYDFTRHRRPDADFSTTAVHGIDTVRYILSADYRSIRFTYRPYPQYGENVANIFMDCIMDTGATAHLEFCPIAGVVVERATVHAYDNTYYLHIPMWNQYDTPGSLVHILNGKVAEELSGEAVNGSDDMFEMCGFYDENAAFFDALQAGAAPGPTLAQSRQSVEIMQAVRERREAYELR